MTFGQWMNYFENCVYRFGGYLFFSFNKKKKAEYYTINDSRIYLRKRKST